MNEQKLNNDLDRKKGYDQHYLSSLSNLQNSLNWLIWNEPNKYLKSEYKKLYDNIIKRQAEMQKTFISFSE